jgi:SAM-dependent methyltransferase
MAGTSRYLKSTTPMRAFGKYPKDRRDEGTMSRPPDDIHSPEADAWNVEYSAGRYDGEPPLPFVDQILEAARAEHLLGAIGLYVGCGNGRNYVPLVAGGLDLVGIDISGVAIQQLAARLPHRRNRLIHGTIDSLQAGRQFAIVIGIQVFQHGDEWRAHEHVRLAQSRVAPRGLFCIRVNAECTDLEFEHDIVDRNPGGGYTARYLDGPKSRLDVHFFALRELVELFDGFEPVVPPRLSTTWREPPRRGQWSQWEAIWRRP